MSEVIAELDDTTIVAIATPPGRGGIGVVRLSGPLAHTIATHLVRTQQPLSPGRVRLCVVVDHADTRIDDALVTAFRAPHSYTGEDVVEIATHGSPIVLDWLVRAAVQHGAQPARAGEFTERAFLRGRIDLTQAEAVRDLIDAQTLGQVRLAAEQLGGALALQIAPGKQALLALIATLEAGIDFAEDDLDTLPHAQIAQRIHDLLPPLQTLLSSFAHGRLMREGLRLAIVGRPNAGKSSLFNRLVQSDRAIVTATPGTTRDVIAERIALDGIPVELLDTAGLRDTLDEAERIGVQRSRQAIAEADVVLLVTDASQPLHADDADLLASLAGRAALLVRNKCDLQPASPAPQPNIATSALTGEGLDPLRAAVLKLARGNLAAAAGSATLTNLRQRDAVARCIAALNRALAATAAATPHEMLLLDLHEGLQALDELTGQTHADDILHLIFSTFCIGK